MNILITSAGQRVSLVKAFQKELRDYNGGKVYTVDMNPDLSPACQISDGAYSVEKVTSVNYIDDLIRLSHKLQVTVIVPTIDTELQTLSKNRQHFLDLGINIVVSDIKLVDACRDKRIINSYFTEWGVPIPNKIDKNSPSFPLFIKPFDGSLSKDIFVIHKNDELLDFHMLNEKFMFMEYLNPQENEEYTVDAYYDKNNTLRCAVPRKRISVRSGEVSKAVTKKNELLPFMIEKLKYINGAIGCLTIQFFLNKSSKRIVGIEINPRFGGGYPLSYLAGANYPKWIIKEYFENSEIEYFDQWTENLLMLRYDNEVLVNNYLDE